MTDEKRRDAHLDTDWSDVWDSLPEAPSLIARPKTSQVTLRVSERLLTRLKAISAAKSLAYHALSRAWIAEGLNAAPPPIVVEGEAQAAQLNLKLDQALLDALKRKASDLRRPYHALAREFIESAVAREERALGSSPPSFRPAMRDLLVLLLHAPGSRGEEAIRGMTRLQKLLFVIEQKVSPGQHFYAHNYGPFDEAVHDAANALRLAGFLRGSAPIKATAPTFTDMIAAAAQHSGPQDRGRLDVFVLSDDGHDAAERLRRSSRAYEVLFARIAEVRKEWDSPQLEDLVDRVYASWPAYAEKSSIRGEVAERARRRRS